MLRRPPQPADLSRASADPDRAACGADRLGSARAEADRSGFLAACERACVAGGRAADECETGCRCVADAVERSGDADRLATITPERRAELKRLADACMVMRFGYASSGGGWRVRPSPVWVFLARLVFATKVPNYGGGFIWITRIISSESRLINGLYQRPRWLTHAGIPKSRQG